LERGHDPRIPQDLETIVLKAAARDPANRYATAGALADDLCRFLADRPILARRHSRAKQLWCWCRRNPQMAGMLGLVAILFITVGVVGIALAYQFRELALKAGLAKLDAEHNATELRQSIERQNRAYQLLESGHAHSTRSEFGKAIEDLTEAAILQPNMHAVWDARSDCYGMLRLYEPAAMDLARAFELHKSPEASVWYMRASLLLYMNDLTGYRDTCAAMIAHFGSAWGPRNQWWQAEACTLRPGAGIDPEFVVGLAKRATDEDPGASYALTLAAAHFRAGRPAEALRRLERITAPSGSKAGVEWEPLLAMVHFSCGHEVEARRRLSKTNDRLIALLRAMKERPLQYRYVSQGDYDLLKLLLLFREAQALIGGCPHTDELVCQILHARSYAFLGNFTRAEEYLTKAVNNQPDNCLAWLFSGAFWSHRGKWGRALADYQRAGCVQEIEALSDLGALAVLQLCHDHTGAYEATCGSILKRYGQTDNPQEAADSAIYCALGARSNEDAMLLCQLGDRSVRSDPGNAWFRLASGAAHYRAGSFQQALILLRQALEARWPEHLDADAGRTLTQLFQSLALYRLGNRSEASRLWKTAARVVADRIKPDGGANLGRGWYVWAAGQILSREAEARIGAPAE
jgi:tetratricopeptide (TPR) repeat protein